MGDGETAAPASLGLGVGWLTRVMEDGRADVVSARGLRVGCLVKLLLAAVILAARHAGAAARAGGAGAAHDANLATVLE